jgi:hypothetical protein
MSKNRAIGAPLAVTVVASATPVTVVVDVAVDVYAVNQPGGVAAAFTLDPNAVNGDTVLIADAAGNAGTGATNIHVTPSSGQTLLGGVSSPANINTNGGSKRFTFVESLAGWLVS